MSAILPFFCILLSVPVYFISTGIRSRGNSFATSIFYTLMVIVLCLIVYTGQLIPGDFDDLSANMQIALDVGPDFLFRTYAMNPLSAVLLYTVALSGRFELLKIVAVAITYGCLFHSIHYLSRQERFCHGTEMMLALAAMMVLPLWSVADNVRYPMAVSISIVGVLHFLYSETLKKRHIAILLLASALHVGCVVFLLFVVVSGFKRISKLSTVVMLTTQIIGLFIIQWATMKFSTISILQSLSIRANAYFLTGSNYQAWTSWEDHLLSVLMLIAELILFASNKDTSKNLSVHKARKTRFFTLLMAFLIGSVPNSQFIRRYAVYSFPLFLPYLGRYLEQNLFSNSTQQKAHHSLLGLLFFFGILGVFLLRNCWTLARIYW